MNYVNFMRKLEGKEPQHERTANHTTSGLRPLDLQGIVEFTREFGCPNDALEVRQEVPDHRADFFWAGYDRLTWSAALGLYSYNTHGRYFFFAAGRKYQQQQGDTHRQQQDTVPSESPAEHGESDGVASSCDTATPRRSAGPHYEWGVSYGGRPTVGGATPSAQPREELTSLESIAAEYTALSREYDRLLRQTISPEAGGVPSVRDEREGSERSPEDTVESHLRGLERGTGWTIR